ncbi:V-set and immunoglobulin domain-containing protein 10 [Thalassophryne amazonica]|uniref:V-set and immunoglobulin domain-containing protein 10 n=1 Tax=Thalassophryne amazonica TaxID=390379 RepID=UPI001470C1F0|nr:V-set and immunoglobulin domain-containing protein 10 [Thalassophryne amazonica]
MKIVETAALLQLCLYATATVWAQSSTDTVTAAAGDTAILPCYSTGNVTPSLTRWTKDGREVLSGDSAAGQRLSVLPDGSLNIRAVSPEDEGSYLCSSTLPLHASFRAEVQLRVVGGPESLSTFISPAKALPNGTLVTYRGSTIFFNCSSSSNASRQLSWAFRGASSGNNSLVSSTGSWLHFSIEDIQPSAQGNYSCRSRNTVSHQTTNISTQLLVYHVPDRHPECLWKLAQDTYHVHFICSWVDAYPPANLSWVESHGGPDEVYILLSKVSPSLSVTLNRSVLFDGQTVACVAKHEALPPGTKKECSFTIVPPFPEGEPLVTTLEETNVTLTCTEKQSTPPAHTAWKRGLKQEDIIPGSKYILSVDGPVFKLTIINVGKDDEGIYFCRSENPLTVRELEVYLTVKTSSVYTGAIIGVFLAVLIVGSAIIIAKMLYSSRHRVCLGGGLGQADQDREDVVSLVESDDEQIFQDTVPRLPPLTNGCNTTLVQIHGIPSSDQEDTEPPDTSSQQQDDVEKEEPVTLVTY